MRAGLLRHRVSVQSLRSTATRDALGNIDKGSTANWQTDKTVWANVRPLSGREQEIAAQTQADISHAIEMRYNAATTLTPDNRLLFGSRYLEIESLINEGERNIKMIIYAREASGSA